MSELLAAALRYRNVRSKLSDVISDRTYKRCLIIKLQGALHFINAPYKIGDRT
ncbi:MAG: hypothetical protein ACK6A9_11515 [Dolichospermum sp.]